MKPVDRLMRENEELRRRLAEAEHRNDQRFGRFMEHLPGLAWIKDLEGRYVYANDAAIQAFGVRWSDLVGKTDDDLFSPDTAAQFRANDQRAMQSPSGIQIVETLRHDDGLHHSLVSKFPILDREGRVILIGGMAIDISERLRAEEALQKKEAHLRLITDHAPIFIAHCDTERRYQFVNRAYAARLGLEPEDIIGKRIADVLGQQAYESIHPFVERALAGEKVEFDALIPYRAIGSRYMHCAYVPDVAPSGEIRGLVAVVSDVTERKRAEDALRESEARFRTFIDGVQDYAIFILDPEGRVASWNSGAERIKGYTAEEVIGKHMSWFYLPEDVAAGEPEGELERARAVGRSEEEGWRVRKDGSRFWANGVITAIRDEQGHLRGFSKVTRDLTAQKQVEREIAEGRARLDGIINSAMDAVIAVDSRQRIVLFNPAAEEMFQCPAQDAVGSSLDRFISSRFRIEKGLTVGHGDEAGRHTGALGSLTAYRRDGEEFPIEASISQSEVAGERLFTVILRDVTERKRAEEQLRQLTEELEVRVKERTEELTRSQQRLRALAAEVTLTEQKERRRIATELHDYLAQLLVVGRLKLSQGQRWLHNTPQQDWLKELDGLLEQSLTYTRSLVAQLSPPVLHEFGLVVALRWLADQMRQHGLTVAVEAGHEDLDLPEDQAVLLYQSVRELLFNVVKHAGVDRATVSLRLSPEGELRIAVTDRGRGGDFTESATAETMPPRFGLFSIRERMTVMGGTLAIDSGPEQGTCVTLVIPYRAAAAASQEQRVPVAEPANPSASHGKPHQGPLSRGPYKSGVIRVLLVDDHAMVRQGLRSILEGYEDIHIAGEAGNGIEAIELAHSLSPDVVVMDVTMPRMDGIDATRAIKQATPGPLVIGLSVRNDRETEQAMRAAGATGFLTKESAAEQLYQAIRSAIINEVVR